LIFTNVYLTVKNRMGIEINQ